MAAYEELSKEELLKIKSELEAEFEQVKSQGLKLDMSRGKPSTEQLNLSMGMMDVLNSSADLDLRGGRGLPQLRRSGRHQRGKAASCRHDGSVQKTIS